MKREIDANQERRENMNWDKAGNNWNEFRQLVEERWRALSPRQVSRIEGRRDKLVEALQQTYGLSEHQADVEVKRFEAGAVGKTLTSSGRGETERAREFAAGNQTGAPGDSERRH